jgi:hypothetical protein
VGTTRTAFNNGSTSYVYVAAIEGYSNLLCQGSTSAALTAWATVTDWTTALPGLSVDLQITQSLNPDDSFATADINCTLYVQPDAADTFGIESARRTAGAQTYLAATLTHTGTTISVKSTADFASSGEVHIGTECIAYSGKTASTFTGLTRAKYNTGYTSTSARFAHEHRLVTDANSVLLQPLVTAQPRTWIGRMVEVYAHRVVGGVLDVKAQAERVFAGRIAEMRDDANTGCRVIACRSALEIIKDATVGSLMWEGENSEGVYLAAGQAFGMSDGTALVPISATALAVVASGASGNNEINAGWYTASDIADRINSWLSAELTAVHIYGSYSIATPITDPLGAMRTRITWTWPFPGQYLMFKLSLPEHVALAFGFTDIETDPAGNRIISRTEISASGLSMTSASPPLRFITRVDGGPNSTILAAERTGVLVDQYDSLPSSFKPESAAIDGTTYRWGVFNIGDSQMMLAAWPNDDDFAGYFLFVKPVLRTSSVLGFTINGFTEFLLTQAMDESDPFIIRQVLSFEGPLSTVVSRLLLSTGTLNHNGDEDEWNAGAGIPYSWLTDDALLDLAALPGADGSLAVVIDRPTKLSEILRSDLVMRWSFLVWRDGGITFDSWKTPSTSQAGESLEESNKAEPSGHTANQRSSTEETDKWQRSIVKFRYARNVTDPKGDAYRSTTMLVDQTALTDAGGDGKVKTINLRNTYKEFGATGESVKSLLPRYMSLMPMVSRAANIVRRSIDLRYFFSISVGDVVLFSDEFARDPATGTRGITNRPALVVRHMFTLGGETPGGGGPAAMTGEVDLFFLDIDTDRLSATYAPSGDIDDSTFAGDFVNGYDGSTSIVLYEHRYSESTEEVDASHFSAGDKVLIIERDPLDPTDPTMWTRTVDAVSGSTITLTADLSSPAFDYDKKYRVLSQTYSDADATQQIKVYQADDATGLIESDAQPFLYGSGSADAVYTENSSTEIELVPNLVYADGAPRDVGHEQALIRQIDNLLDYKTAIQQAMLWNVIVSNVSHSTGYLLVSVCPVFLSYEKPSLVATRLLTISPMARSSDGTSTSIKVSLWRSPPGSSTLHDITPGGIPVSSAEWTGITSTSMAVLTAKTLTTGVIKHPFEGMAWLVIELGYKCQTYGLSRMVEGVRTAG